MHADRYVTLMPGHRQMVLASLDTRALVELDRELERRAALVGRPNPHVAVKRAWWAAAKEEWPYVRAMLDGVDAKASAI